MFTAIKNYILFIANGTITKTTKTNIKIVNECNLKKSATINTNNTNCPICLETIKDMYITKCKHEFCVSCISEYIKDKSHINCPICRRILYYNEMWLNNDNKKNYMCDFELIWMGDIGCVCAKYDNRFHLFNMWHGEHELYLHDNPYTWGGRRNYFAGTPYPNNLVRYN
jgi:hypothetical protein